MLEEIKKRFLAKVTVSPSGCWEWQGSRLANGYGQFRNKGIDERLAHRVSFILANGDLSKDLCVLHSCDNRRCVNPHHLFKGTYKDNIHDMLRKGREVSFNRNKTHCKRGHEFSQTNTHIDVRGMRQCRICIRAKFAAFKVKQREVK